MSDFPPPPPPSSPYQPQPQPVPQRARNGLAIAALIFGIIGVLSVFLPFGLWVAGILGTIGLILGLIGYGRFQRSEAANGTMALWGIIISAIALVISIVGAVILVGTNLAEELAVKDAAESTVTPTTETSAQAQPEETAPTGTEVDVYDLEVGDCLATSPPEEEELISSLDTVPCSEPHGEEIFAAVTLPDGDFPGTDAIYAQGDKLCIAEFDGFVGLPYEESALDFWLITPSEQSWPEGDRVVLCTIYDPAGEVSGTLRGVER